MVIFLSMLLTSNLMLRFETILAVSRTMSEACLLHSDQFFLVLFHRTDLMDKCLYLVVFLKMEISKRIKVMVYRYDFFSDFGFPQDLRSKRVGFHSSPDLSLPCLPLAYFFSSLFSGESFYQLGAQL